MRYIYDGNDGRELLRELIYSSNIEVLPGTKIMVNLLKLWKSFAVLMT